MKTLSKGQLQMWRDTLLANPNNDADCVEQLSALCDMAEAYRRLRDQPDIRMARVISENGDRLGGEDLDWVIYADQRRRP